jgi:hypothetical protein
MPGQGAHTIVLAGDDPEAQNPILLLDFQAIVDFAGGD